MNEVAQALHDGLDRLRERGLTKRKLCDRETGRVCARGALFDSTPETVWGSLMSDDHHAAADRLLSAVALEQYPDRTGVTGWAIVDFNNHPDTTQEDVERVFEKAIVRAYEVLS